MKKLLLILLCLPLLFNSCSKEDDETIQPNNTSALSIDVNLVGYWLYSPITRSFIFGSNGEFYWEAGTYDKWGSYWTESGYIILNGTSNGSQGPYAYSSYFEYNIEGDELTISGTTYLKQ